MLRIPQSRHDLTSSLPVGIDRPADDKFAAKPQMALTFKQTLARVAETLAVAANTTGGVTAKMISPQSIAVACAATGLVGKESELFRFTVRHSLLFAVIVGVITLVQAYLLPGMVP